MKESGAPAGLSRRAGHRRPLRCPRHNRARCHPALCDRAGRGFRLVSRFLLGSVFVCLLGFLRVYFLFKAALASRSAITPGEFPRLRYKARPHRGSCVALGAEIPVFHSGSSWETGKGNAKEMGKSGKCGWTRRCAGKGLRWICVATFGPSTGNLLP